MRGSGGSGLETGSFEFCEYEGVYWFGDPCGLVDGGEGRSLNGLPGPVFGAELAEVPGAFGGGGVGFSGPGSAESHPFGKDVDVVRAEFSGGWHFEPLPANGVDEQAVIGSFGDERGSAVAALEQGGAGIESESGAERFCGAAVTGEAVFSEQWSDAVFEPGGLFFGGFRWRLQGNRGERAAESWQAADEEQSQEGHAARFRCGGGRVVVNCRLAYAGLSTVNRGVSWWM